MCLEYPEKSKNKFWEKLIFEWRLWKKKLNVAQNVLKRLNTKFEKNLYSSEDFEKKKLNVFRMSWNV
jgi:hypothetical protein